MPGRWRKTVWHWGTAALADRDNSVSVGREGQERFLTHVAAGIAKTDAVNKGQLDEERDARIAGDKQTLKQAMDYTDVSIQYSEAKTNKRITEEQQARIEGGGTDSGGRKPLYR